MEWNTLRNNYNFARTFTITSAALFTVSFLLEFLIPSSLLLSSLFTSYGFIVGHIVLDTR